MKLQKITILIGILLFSCFHAVGKNAQDTLKEVSNSKKNRPLQFTFIYPLGSNGINSPNYSNNFSLNILGGYNGGVKACEIGAFANINYGDVFGFQSAGFANVNRGKTDAFQAAGFYNQSDEFMGGQFAGFLNLNTANSGGFQGAGFANIVRGNMTGWQSSGFTNVVSDSVKGAQIAGFGNFAKSSVDGGQIAGFINVAEDVEGAQVSGFLNLAKNVKGSQIGVFNVADSVDGVSVGFLSIVKNGYRKVEFGANESLYANVSFKTGVQHFYNIFTAGYRQDGDFIYWSYGYGVGSLWSLSDKFNLNIDVTANQINENEWHTNRLNLLNTFKLNLGYKFKRGFELVAGPSYNVMVSDFDFREGIGTNSSFAPWAFYDVSEQQVNVKMYLGLNAALRF